MIRNFFVLNILFYFLGAYHFQTFNILEFDEVSSIIKQEPYWETPVKFIVNMEMILLFFSYLLYSQFNMKKKS